MAQEDWAIAAFLIYAASIMVVILIAPFCCALADSGAIGYGQIWRSIEMTVSLYTNAAIILAWLGGNVMGQMKPFSWQSALFMMACACTCGALAVAGAVSG